MSDTLTPPAADKTRIAVSIPSDLYTRLCQRVGWRGMSRFCQEAIERELEREKVTVPQS
jgi:post-segregation antitoxin (ccd killing protein)